MPKRSFSIIFFVLLLAVNSLSGQYQFSGQLKDSIEGIPVYLSWIKDYRKISGVFPDQVIGLSYTDSLGRFVFKGDGLKSSNQIYRIHTDDCDNTNNHIFEQCNTGERVAFIASNQDTLHLPISGDNQVFCEIISTNESTGALLAIDQAIENMEFELGGIPTDGAIEVNARSWFQKLQELGSTFDDPLAEVYVFDHLSERRSSLYPYYLEDLRQNEYYDNLAARLEVAYPESTYLASYQQDLRADKSVAIPPEEPLWTKVVLGLLIASVFLNIYFLYWKPRALKNRKTQAVESLTAQEEKILHGIRARKTNKELASELFISVSTVKTHINSIYKKLGVTQREQLY